MNIFKQIYWMMKGKEYKDIDVDTFYKGMKEDPNAVVIDVRNPSEKEEGDIPGSKLINIMDAGFKDEIEKLDKSKSYYIYCRSGNRSGSACGLMASLGFKNLYNLAGGIKAWNEHSKN